jgi:hypothetical protein
MMPDQDLKDKYLPKAAPPPKGIFPWQVIAVLMVLAVLLLAIPGFINLVSTINARFPWLTVIFTFLKGFIVAAAFTLIPILTGFITRFKNQIVDSLVEILLFSIILVVVDLLMFQHVGSSWLLYSIAIGSVLVIGGHGIDYIRDEKVNCVTREIESKRQQLGEKKKASQTKALSDDIFQYNTMLRYAYTFGTFFYQEGYLYSALPLGVLSGVSLGIYEHTSAIGYIDFSIQHISFIATIILTFFIYKAIGQMVKPVYIGRSRSRHRIIFTSDEMEKLRGEKERIVGFGKTTTELRELYLYDSIHNVLLLCIFLYLFLGSIAVTFSLKIAAFAILLMLTLCSQLPFMIGQSLLRQYILRGYGGYARGVMENELKKEEYAPLLKKPELWLAFSSLGTGGLLFFLAEKFIKELF